MCETKPETPVVEDPNSGWYGIFYYNPSNPRVCVRRRRRKWSNGWTLNFARPATYAILFALLAIPVPIVIYALTK